MKFIKHFSLLMLLAVLFSCGQPAPGTVKTVQFGIEGMSCAHSCAPTIQEKISAMAGVKAAKVDFESKSAWVSYDDGITNPEAIKNAVEAIAEGVYQVSSSKEIAAFPKDSIQ